jgi:hypothetical protein
MAKISELPKASKSNNADRLTVLQNGKVKTITKKSLLGELEAKLSRLAGQIKSINKNTLAKTVLKDAPSFSKPAKGKNPTNANHLSTKSYVDKAVSNVLRSDGSIALSNNLSYSGKSIFSDNDLVDKEFVDTQLKSALKTVQRRNGSNGYPAASAGDVILIDTDHTSFATDGPEIQAGDILICLSDSAGGTYGEVGNQFAIVNTNVIDATESKAGILKKSTDLEIEELATDDSVVSPLKLKNAIEATSAYNRTPVSFTSYTLTEADKGLIGVDCRRGGVTLTLPTIASLKHPKLVKYRIKDEYKSSVKNSILIKSSSTDSIQGANSFRLSSDGGSIKLYTDGDSRWFIENNLPVDLDAIKVKSVLTDNTTTGERVAAAATEETLMAINVDLSDYPVGTSFKLVASCAFAATANDKTVKLVVDGNTVLDSSNAEAAPNAKFGVLEATLLHSDTMKTIAYSKGLVGTTQAVGVINTLDIDWERTITVSVDVTAATAVGDINLYSFQIIPLK